MSPYVTALVICTAGCLVAHLALQRHGVRGGVLLGYTLGFGPLVGQGLASLQIFYWRLVGWPAPGLVAFAALTAAALLATRWAGSRPATAPEQRPTRRFSLLDLLGAVAFGGALVAVCQAYRAFTAQWPQGSWDAVASWNLRARLLFHGYDRFPDLLRDTASSAMPHYPLLLPGLLAAQYVWAGQEMPALPQVISLINVVAVGTLLCTLVADWSDRVFGAAAAALFWSAMPLWLVAFSQGADVLVAYALLAAFAVMASLLPGAALSSLPGGLGGWAIGLLLWTKIEGLPLVLILSVGYVLTAWTTGRPLGLRRQVGWLIAAALPGAGALYLFKAYWMPTTAADMYLQGDWVARLISEERWWIPLRAILQRPVPVGASHGWWYLWTALAVGLAAGLASRSWWRDSTARFWALTVAGTVAFWLVTYAATPFPLEWQLASSLDRLMVQVYPLAVAGVVGGLGMQLRLGHPR